MRAGALVAILAAMLAIAAAPADWRAPFVLQPGSGLFAQYGYYPDHTRSVPRSIPAVVPAFAVVLREEAACGPGRAWVAGDRGTLMTTDDGA